MLAPIRIGHHLIDPPIFLAPMAGVTDAPFRALVRRFGAGLVASEMVASQEFVTERRGVREKALLSPSDGLAAVQISGREAEWMSEAARMAVDAGAPIIDVNMGCPAKKVTSGYSGAALMRDPDEALRLLEAVIAAVPVPVTLKMRLGWDDVSKNAVEIATRAESVGIRLITVHGRTRAQFYKGVADWTAIGEVVAATKAPVIANGDIVDGASARAALSASGAAGVMIGRGAQGRPWILAEIAAHLADAPFERPGVSARLSLMKAHYQSMIEHYGGEVGRRCARKHFGWWLRDLEGGEALRVRLVRLDAPDAVLAEIEAFREERAVLGSEDPAVVDAPWHGERCAA